MKTFREFLYEHCGCEDKAVNQLENGLKKLGNTSYDSIDKLMRGIMKEHDMTAKQLHNAFVKKHNQTPDDWIKGIKEDAETYASDKQAYDKKRAAIERLDQRRRAAKTNPTKVSDRFTKSAQKTSQTAADDAAERRTSYKKKVERLRGLNRKSGLIQLKKDT